MCTLHVPVGEKVIKYPHRRPYSSQTLCVHTINNCNMKNTNKQKERERGGDQERKEKVVQYTHVQV